MVFTNDITKRVKVQSLMASYIYIYIKKESCGLLLPAMINNRDKTYLPPSKN